MREITRLLQQAGPDEPAARSKLYSLIYDELNLLARRALSREATCTQLDAHSVVHEAYLRFANRGDLEFENRRAFFGYAARVMRSVVLDTLREQIADKRRGSRDVVTLSTSIEDRGLRATDLVAIDAALQSLAQVDSRSHDLFEMHFFAGMDVDDICEELELSPATVRRDLRKARAFVTRQIDGS
jgi:RNA polymerase sigma factor (TIGR02999 family)